MVKNIMLRVGLALDQDHAVSNIFGYYYPLTGYTEIYGYNLPPGYPDRPYPPYRSWLASITINPAVALRPECP